MKNFIDQLQTAPGPFSKKPNPRLGQRRRRRLVENLQLDAPGLRPAGWSYPAAMPAGRGGNLLPAHLSEATARLDAHPSVRTPGTSFTSLLREAGEALNPANATGGCDYFFRVGSSATPLTGTLWNVCSLHALQYSFRGAGAAWKKAVHDWLTAADPASRPVQPDGGQVGLCRIGSAFWLSEQSPFDLLAARGITAGTQAAAWCVLRELALPGFETRQRRKDAMGLIALEFPATLLQDPGNAGHAWKPSAIDALNFKGYCFLPGRAADGHGLTWPLRQSLQQHENRDGLREYVHPHIAIPALEGGARKVHLLGFLDADEEAAWNSLSFP